MPFSFIMPVEWAICISENDDPEDCGFEEEHLVEWLSEHRHLNFSHLGERVDTSEHVLSSGYYHGESLICRQVFFIDSRAGTSRHPMRRELRISVPAPTKLPLP